MFATLSRPYKECSAKETVEKIRGILETLKIVPEITYSGNPYPEVYSTHLSLPISKGGYGSNGKGRSEDYCLASAYAEFIERLQAGVYTYFPRTLQTQLYREFGFYYYPREKFLTLDEFCELPEVITNDLIRYSGQAREEFIERYFERINDHNAPGLIAVPFLCSKTQKEVYIPLNPLLTVIATNGIASGNSYDEALHHALCEIIERWAGAEIFYNRLTPPNVPEAFLRQFTEECRIIDKIEKSGKYKVTIKDFSAGLRLPAVGIILQNLQQDTYRLNIGSDTSFQVALSRCLTEVFQGYRDEEALDQISLEIPHECPPHFMNDDEDSFNLRYAVFAHFVKDGDGIFPPDLFAADESYQFDASVFATKQSYKEESKALIEFFHSFGSTVYVQEYSYLGFPTIFAYVPEISSFGKKNVPISQPRSTYELIETDKIESKIFHINYDSSEDCLSLATSLSTLPAYTSVPDLFYIGLEEDAPGTEINISFLLAQLWFRLGDFKEAAESFGVFLLGYPDKSEYYEAMGKYLDILASGRTPAEARQEIENELGQTNNVQRACHDLEHHKEFFARLHLPKCPDCSECPLVSKCLTSRMMDISRILYPVMKQAFPPQA